MHYIVAIIVTGALVIIIIFAIAWWKGCLKRKVSLEKGKLSFINLFCHKLILPA